MLLKMRGDASSINQALTSLSSFRHHSSLNHPAGMQRQNEMMEGFVDKSDRNTTIAKEVDKIAEQTGHSSSQIALSWLLSKGVIPIVGARKVSHVEDNLKCIDVKLLAEQIKQLDDISQIELGFPHDFFKAEMVRNFVYNGTFDKINNHRYSQLNN